MEIHECQASLARIVKGVSGAGAQARSATMPAVTRKACECGCGEAVKLGNRFIIGHNSRVFGEEVIEKIRAKLRKPESYAKQCKCGCGKYAKPYRKYIDGHCMAWNKGLTKDADERVAKAGSKISLAWKERVGPKLKRRPKLCECGCGDLAPSGCKFVYNHHTKGENNPMHGKGHLRTGNKNSFYGKKHSINSIEKMLKSQRKVLAVRPNRLESDLLSLLNELFQDDYKYVGDRSFIIGGKNPDFVNINGQKKIIEVNGDYWHSEEIVGCNRNKHEQEMVQHYKGYGFDCLVIWESEFRNEANHGSLVDKLVYFHNK